MQPLPHRFDAIDTLCGGIYSDQSCEDEYR
jgi:hypothetical protein